MFFNPRFSLVRAKKINGKWQIKFFARNVEASTVAVTDEMGNEKKDEKGNTIYRPMTESELEALPEDDWRRYPDSTEWGIGWVPFGGYCAIAGMVDETKAATDLPSEPQPWEFRSKNVWQRMCIIVGGILVNFVAALLIFGMMLFHWGKDELPLSQIHTGLYYSDFLVEEGFQQQDKIISINGVEPRTLNDAFKALIVEGQRDVVVLRGTDTIALTMTPNLGERYVELQNEKEGNYLLMAEFMPLVVDSVKSGTAAASIFMQEGDSIVGINDADNLCYIQILDELKKCSGDSVTIKFYRNGQLIQERAYIDETCLIGVTPKSPGEFYTPIHTDYTFFEAIPAGIQYGWSLLETYVQQFKFVFTKAGAQSVGGFGAISSMFPESWDWQSFWHITAFLSLILAFMNFLPIPALDGGYILFLLWEIITHRKPSDKFLEIANTIGFWLLMALMVYANGNDIFKALF